MQNPKIRTNRLLFLFMILISLCLGAVLTRSSSGYFSFNPIENDNTLTAQKEPSISEIPEISDIPSVTPVPEVTATPVPEENKYPNEYKVSPEAEIGKWVSSGSNWLFMVNDVPYTGWLYDVDGHSYYLNKDGIMQTGWLDQNGKRYYLDEDGIMQKGTLLIDGQEYTFSSDGSLKDYTSPQKESSSQKEDFNHTHNA